MLQSLQNLFAKEQNFKVILLSAANGGRTTILYKLVLGQLISCVPTNGFNVQTYQFQKLTKMQIWDITINSHMVKLWRHYYQKTNRIVFVIDLTCLNKYKSQKDLQMKILATVNDEMDQGIPFVIFFNKKDLYTEKQYKFAQEITSIITSTIKEKRPYKIVYTSAFPGQGIKQGMKDLLMLMRMKKLKNK